MQQPRTIPRSGAALILPRQPAEGQNRESGTEKAEQRRQNREGRAEKHPGWVTETGKYRKVLKKVISVILECFFCKICLLL